MCMCCEKVEIKKMVHNLGRMRVLEEFTQVQNEVEYTLDPFWNNLHEFLKPYFKIILLHWKMDPDIQGIVLDCGSGYTKCGFSGDGTPRAIFPSIVGRPKHMGFMPGWDFKDCFVGDEAQAKRGILRLKYPIEHGMVTNWNDMEKIWHHTFYNELRVTPEEHSVLISESLFNPKNNREKMTSIMFETFNIFAFSAMSSSVLSLYAAGRTNGLSVEIGDSVTHIAPIYEGQVLEKSSQRMNIGGRDVTDNLVKILSDIGYEMTTSAEREIVRDIKEKLCFCSFDYDEDLRKYNDPRENNNIQKEEEYELPDGSKMSIGSELFRSPEILFQPNLIGSELDGIPGQIINSIQSLPKDEELRNLMVKNICVSGGSSRFRGLLNRTRKDIDRLLLHDLNESCDDGGSTMVRECGILAPEMREFAAWTGGSIFSSLSWFVKNKYIMKDDYDDCGASIIHRMCL